MDAFKKQILIFILVIFSGIGLALSGFTEIIHDYSSKNLMPIFENEKNEDAGKLAASLGYFAELLLSSIILITPICAVSGIWFLKIAYELIVGKSSQVNVFLIHQSFNTIVAVLCLILFIYCIYSQYQWTIRLTQPRQKIIKDSDLNRFI